MICDWQSTDVANVSRKTSIVGRCEFHYSSYCDVGYVFDIPDESKVGLKWLKIRYIGELL
jgi:hypothetical protein